MSRFARRRVSHEHGDAVERERLRLGSRTRMIKVTRLNGSELVINADLIETIEERPDTIITLTNEHRFVVRESIDELLDRLAAYRRRCHPGVRGLAPSAALEAGRD